MHTLSHCLYNCVSSPCVQFEKGNAESEAQLFSVPDFIGFACREVASKIRASVASLPFEQFHKYSNDIIRAGVFGKSEEGELKEELIFNANNLVSPHLLVALYMNPPGEISFTSRPLYKNHHLRSQLLVTLYMDLYMDLPDNCVYVDLCFCVLV